MSIEKMKYKIRIHIFFLLSLTACNLLLANDSLCNSAKLDYEQLQHNKTLESAYSAILEASKITRKQVIFDLICIIESDQFNDTAKGAATCILGEIKAKEAIPLLVKNISRSFIQSETMFNSLICSPYQALIKIGKPAKKRVVSHLDSCRHYKEFWITMFTLISIEQWDNQEAKMFCEKKYIQATGNAKEYCKEVIGELEKKIEKDKK